MAALSTRVNPVCTGECRKLWEPFIVPLVGVQAQAKKLSQPLSSHAEKVAGLLEVEYIMCTCGSV